MLFVRAFVIKILDKFLDVNYGLAIVFFQLKVYYSIIGDDFISIHIK